MREKRSPLVSESLERVGDGLEETSDAVVVRRKYVW
jgi:hypothetical protein